MTLRTLVVLVGSGLATVSTAAYGEPIFLSKQYTRCTTCHYSLTGGGLLTPYGRSLSRQELSTMGHTDTPPQQGLGEEQFLFGALGDKLGSLNLGFDTRPAYLSFNVGGSTSSQTIFLNADLLAAYRSNGWTVYGELGREPLPLGSKIDSYEYWVGRDFEDGLSVRAGRFLPAYGIRFADHTDLTRASLGFDIYDQVYGLEVSQSWEKHLLQVCVSPGRADSILHNDGLRAFTTSARFQIDLGPKTELVLSGIYRDGARLLPQNGSGGVSFGIAPTSRLSVWNEADIQFEQGSGGTPSYTLLNETSFEVYRGLWLKFSPQLRTELGNTSAGIFRLDFEANLLPRTHFNVDVSYYHDEDRGSGLISKTFLAQLHLYL